MAKVEMARKDRKRHEERSEKNGSTAFGVLVLLSANLFVVNSSAHQTTPDALLGSLQPDTRRSVVVYTIFGLVCLCLFSWSQERYRRIWIRYKPLADRQWKEREKERVRY